MRRQSMVLAAALSAMVMLAGGARADFQSGADHLVDYQNGDGGWTWQYGIPGGYDDSSPANTASPIGLGLLNAYSYTGDASHLEAAELAGSFVLSTGYTNGEARFASYDSYFLINLSDVTGNASYANGAATGFFDELTNGTYGPSNYDTAGWISAVQTSRTGSWVNLRPWDFATLAYAADQIGNAGQGDLFENAIIAGLGTLDSSAYYDYLGLAGGLYGLSLRGTDIGTTSLGTFGSADSSTELAALLAAGQNADGSWFWSSTVPGGSDVGNEATQVTAYAVLALIEADAAGFGNWDTEIAAGRNWLWSMQNSEGGFASWGDGSGLNHEVEGEALQAVPEPMTMVMLGALGAGMFAAQRRRRN